MLILRVVLSAAVLVAGAGIASAERKVDWSEFLEKPGERGPTIKHEEVAPAAPKAKATAKVAKKKTTAKAKKKSARRSAKKRK